MNLLVNQLLDWVNPHSTVNTYSLIHGFSLLQQFCMSVNMFYLHSNDSIDEEQHDDQKSNVRQSLKTNRRSLSGKTREKTDFAFSFLIYSKALHLLTVELC